MKKLIIAFMLAALPGLGLAAGAGPHLDHVNINLDNKQSLRNGARLFVNYCLNCHSANYMRYKRMGDDLGISEEVGKQNIMFTTEKWGEPMGIAMRAADAEKWFGTLPPDLSVIARSKGAGSEGADWLYTYLRSFYVDPSRPFGVNNTVFPDVGMPHVMGDMQGMQRLINADELKAHKSAKPEFELVSPGSMSAGEYDKAVRDLVAYLVYMGEPGQMARRNLGAWVLLFLVVLFFVSYALKKEYWKDVH